MKIKPLLTITICTYNRADYLKDTLAGLSVQTADYRQFEILVVNNNSTDHTVSVCSQFKKENPDLNFRMVTETVQGLSQARNRAFSEAASSHILYIDDDVRINPEFVEQGIGCLHQIPDLKCAGGRILVTFEGSDPGWIPSELMPMFGYRDLGDQKKIYPDDNFPCGCNMLIHKELFEKTGMFDTELGRKGPELTGSEEKAFFERVRKKGFNIWYLPELTLHHRIGENRLQKEYLRKQSIGIGFSEYLRLRHSFLKLTRKLFFEMIKLCGSFVLSIGYLAMGNVKAASFIIIFRFWVLKGFFKRT